MCKIRSSIVVSISACHAEDPGSIPGCGDFCGHGPNSQCQMCRPCGQLGQVDSFRGLSVIIGGNGGAPLGLSWRGKLTSLWEGLSWGRRRQGPWLLLWEKGSWIPVVCLGGQGVSLWDKGGWIPVLCPGGKGDRVPLFLGSFGLSRWKRRCGGWGSFDLLWWKRRQDQLGPPGRGSCSFLVLSWTGTPQQ